MKTLEKLVLGAGAVGGGFVVGWLLRCVLAPCSTTCTPGSPSVVSQGEGSGPVMVHCTGNYTLLVAGANPGSPVRAVAYYPSGMTKQVGGAATDACGNATLQAFVDPVDAVSIEVQNADGSVVGTLTLSTNPSC